jgi:hypothetical protein
VRYGAKNQTRNIDIAGQTGKVWDKARNDWKTVFRKIRRHGVGRRRFRRQPQDASFAACVKIGNPRGGQGRQAWIEAQICLEIKAEAMDCG